MAGGEEAKRAGDKAGGAVAVVAVETEVGACFGAGAGGAILLWENLRFGGIDAGDVEQFFGFAGKGVFVAKMFSNLHQEAVVSGQGQVGQLDGGGIFATSSAADGDDRDFALAATGDEEALIWDVVDSVQDVVIATGQDRIGGRGQKELGNFVEAALGVDGTNARGHGADFGLANRAVHGVKLAIDVADAHFVEIDQGKLTDAAAGQGLNSPRTDATDAHDANMGLAQALESGC